VGVGAGGAPGGGLKEKERGGGEKGRGYVLDSRCEAYCRIHC